MFGVSDLAEVVATLRDKFVKKYVLSARYVLFVVKFIFFFISIVYSYYLLPISVNKRCVLRGWSITIMIILITNIIMIKTTYMMRHRCCHDFLWGPSLTTPTSSSPHPAKYDSLLCLGVHL